QPMEPPSSAEMRAFAYRLLGRREYSVHELDRRIRQKWPEAGGVGELVSALEAENLVCDQRFTESFVRSRIQRHQGPLKIRAELRARGVSDSLIERQLGGYAEQWTSLAREWLQRQIELPAEFDQKKKYYRRLQSRGFTHDQAMDALG
ncbi:MAG: regulatory protein RecX, partial [Xanthomonadales bacterium]|nr:regulatory protein RecX [Xanthomonadales bacterium]